MSAGRCNAPGHSSSATEAGPAMPDPTSIRSATTSYESSRQAAAKVSGSRPSGAAREASYRARTTATRRRAVSSVDIEFIGLPALSSEIALQVALGLLRRGVAANQAPEPIGMTRLYQMCQLVKQDVIHHPGWHRLQAVRQTDTTGARRTRSPALLLVSDPGNTGRLGHVIQSRR